jgi:hypothetical protein
MIRVRQAASGFRLTTFRTLKGQLPVEIDFQNLDELARMAVAVVTSAAQQWKETTAPTVAEL